MEVDDHGPERSSDARQSRPSRRDRHEITQKNTVQPNLFEQIKEPVISIKNGSGNTFFPLAKIENRGFSNPYITNASCDAQCDFEDVTSKEPFSLQVGPSTIELETKILPMVNDPEQNEVRIPTSALNPEKLSILKCIVKENNLSLISLNKENDAFYVVRKKAKTQKDQVKEIESKLKAIAKSQSLYRTPTLTIAKPVMTSFCCQADVDKEIETNEKAYKREKARKRTERQNRLNDALITLKNKPIMKVETEMQTAPDGSWVCPWCGQDILHDQLIGHEPVCRSQYNYLKNELKLKRKPNKNVQKSGQEFPKVLNIRKTFSRSKSKGKSLQRSKSRASMNRMTRILSQELDKLKDPNDVNALIQISSKLCSLQGCNLFSVDGTKLCPLHQNSTPMATTTDMDNRIESSQVQGAEDMRKTELRSALRQRISMFEDRRRK